MSRARLGQVSYSNNSFIVAIMFDGKRKYDYDFIKSIITDVYGNITNDKTDEVLIKKLFNTNEFKELEESILEKKEDNEFIH